MANKLKAVYDAINTNWDQVNYPATIRYFEPVWKNRNMPNKILIEIELDSVDVESLSRDSITPRQEINNILVHVYYENPQADIGTNIDYCLVTLIHGQLLPILDSNLEDFEVVRYDFEILNTAKNQVMFTVHLRCYDVLTS